MCRVEAWAGWSAAGGWQPRRRLLRGCCLPPGGRRRGWGRVRGASSRVQGSSLAQRRLGPAGRSTRASVRMLRAVCPADKTYASGRIDPQAGRGWRVWRKGHRVQRLSLQSKRGAERWWSGRRGVVPPPLRLTEIEIARRNRGAIRAPSALKAAPRAGGNCRRRATLATTSGPHPPTHRTSATRHSLAAAGG